MKANPGPVKDSEGKKISAEGLGKTETLNVVLDKKLEKVRSKSFDSKLSFYKNHFKFDEKELLMIKRRFLKITNKGPLDKHNFRKSLGILGLEHAAFLSDRIFDIIDEDHDGKANFEDFVKYMDTLINGKDHEKALQSFKIIDTGHKGKIVFEDLEKMVYGISFLWNSLTGSKVVPSKEYLENIFETFDKKKTGEVYFSDYMKVYQNDAQIFGWFEYLNQDDFEKIEEVRRNRMLSDMNEMRASQMEKESYQKQIQILEKEIKSCIELVKTETQKNELESLFLGKSVFGSGSMNRITEESEILKSARGSAGGTNGPQFHNSHLSNFKKGDGSPVQSPSGSKKNLCFSSGLGTQTKTIYLDGALSVKQKADHALDPTGFESRNHTPLEKVTEKLNMLMDMAQSLKEKKEDGKHTAHTQESSQSPKKGNNNLLVPNRKQSFPKIMPRTVNPDYEVTRRTTVKNIPNKKIDVKQNLSVYFGHENWNIMLNMMFGIRHSIKNLYPANDLTIVQDHDFHMKGHYNIIQKRTETFDITSACEFYEYAPGIFERIRKRYKISNDDYLKAVGPEQMLGSIIMGNLSSLTELCSTGKSGSFFYFSLDGKFMLKTISRDEFKLTRKILKPYYEHIMEYRETLISRLYGLHKMVMFKSKRNKEKIYFIIMANLFHTPYEIDIRYDLKGSLYGRTARSPKTHWDKSIALKDLDFLEESPVINLPQREREILIRQVNIDCEFFKENGIIDYSMLIGIHNIRKEEMILFNSENSFEKSKENTEFFEKFKGGIASSDRSKIYFIGIIDILTKYNTKKKFEYNFKKTFFGSGISCVPPNEYAERFKKFMTTVAFKT